MSDSISFLQRFSSWGDCSSGGGGTDCTGHPVVSIAVVSVVCWRMIHKARTADMIPMQMSALEVNMMEEAKDVSCVLTNCMEKI